MAKAMIELKHLSKHYRSKNAAEIWALKDVSLTVHKGSIFGIVGQSGAGKTSLLRSINMLEPPTSGEVFLGGKNLMALSKEELLQERRNIGMIFQNFNLLSEATVFDNVALPLRLKKIEKRNLEDIVIPLLKLTGIENKKDAYPKELSGGQKQRVAIARALATNPKVLLSVKPPLLLIKRPPKAF
jgi:D-methionine transport system ATP-binding protein